MDEQVLSVLDDMYEDLVAARKRMFAQHDAFFDDNAVPLSPEAIEGLKLARKAIEQVHQAGRLLLDAYSIVQAG